MCNEAMLCFFSFRPIGIVVFIAGTNCKLNVDECASNPCKNGGTCHDQVASFSCSCVSGYVYTDEFCEYDDCTPQPCNNNATCIDLTSHFQCICPQGYYGDLCEVIDLLRKI